MPGADQEKYEQVLGAQTLKGLDLGEYSWITQLPKEALQQLLGLLKPSKTRKTAARDDAFGDIENEDSYKNPFL